MNFNSRCCSWILVNVHKYHLKSNYFIKCPTIGNKKGCSSTYCSWKCVGAASSKTSWQAINKRANSKNHEKKSLLKKNHNCNFNSIGFLIFSFIYYTLRQKWRGQIHEISILYIWKAKKSACCKKGGSSPPLPLPMLDACDLYTCFQFWFGH